MRKILSRRGYIVNIQIPLENVFFARYHTQHSLETELNTTVQTGFIFNICN